MTRRTPLERAYEAATKSKVALTRTVIAPDGTVTIHHVDADSGRENASSVDDMIADFVTKGAKRGKDHRAN